MSLKSDDAGFTLIELLVSVVILGFIVAALSTALIAVIHNTNGTSQRLAESHDAQVAAAYFGNDVQSAAVTGTVVPGNPLYDPSCNDPVAGSVSVVEFRWWEYDASARASYNLAVYSTEPAAGVGTQPLLRRRFCQQPFGGALSLKSDATMAHVLSASTAPSFCSSPSPCAGQPSNAVALTVTEASGYQFVVSGVRRATG